jgi:hypothetical protein
MTALRMEGRGAMMIKIKWGRLNGNSHGTPGVKPWDRKTLRSTWQIVALGRDSYMRVEGRTLIGRRLWIYGRSGACVNLDITLKFKRCPYSPPSKYAPRPGAQTMV